MRSGALCPALAAGLAGAAVAAIVVPEAGSAPGCPVVPSPADEAGIIQMTNSVRASRGATTLRRDDSIGDAARRWSIRMANTGAFVHSTLGWTRGRPGGENIAQASTARRAFRAMLDSPPHRANMLASAWRFVGIGVATRCDGMKFVTMNLMAPPSIRL